MRSFYNPLKSARGESSSNHILSQHFEQSFDIIAPSTSTTNPNTTCETIPPSLNNIPIPHTNIDSFFISLSFSKSEYNSALMSLKLHSAPGPDLISNRILKRLPHETHSFILKMFNLMYHRCIFPAE